MADFNQSKLTVGIEEELFFVPETTPGTPDYAALIGARVVRLISTPGMAQPLPFLMDEQRRFTHSQLSRPKGRRQAATFDMEAYFKPSGVLNTPPEIHYMLKGLLGRATIGGGAVTYNLSPAGEALPQATAFLYKGNTQERVTDGCVVNSGKFIIKAANDQASLLPVTFNVMGWETRQMTSDLLAGGPYVGGETLVTVPDARRFEPGVLFQIRDPASLTPVGIDDGAGAGYRITAVNYATNILTITPALVDAHTAAADVYLEPWRPTATESGSILHGSIGLTTLDDGGGPDTLEILEMELNVDNGVMVPNEIQNNSDYPSLQVRAGKRTVSGMLRVYLQPQHGRYIRDHYAQQSFALFARVDNVAGADSIKFQLPKIQMDFPDDSGDEIKEATIPFTAFATSASSENELQIQIEAP